MKNKLKETFDYIEAGSELKDSTRAFLTEKTRGYTKAKSVNYRHLIPAAACLVLLFLGGHRIYFTPTVEISIDINPSLELGVNRFDKVISVNGYNDDGQELADTLHIKYTDCTEAVTQILETEQIESLLSDDGVLTVTVVGPEGDQTVRVLSDMEECTSKHQNTYCYSAHKDDVGDAHEHGLSYGKYNAFLELQELNPDITPEEIQGMTMKEIRDLIHECSDEAEDSSHTSTAGRHGYDKNINEKGQHNNKQNTGKKHRHQ